MLTRKSLQSERVKENRRKEPYVQTCETSRVEACYGKVSTEESPQSNQRRYGCNDIEICPRVHSVSAPAKCCVSRIQFSQPLECLQRSYQAWASHLQTLDLAEGPK